MRRKGYEFHNGHNSLYFTGDYDSEKHTFEKDAPVSLDYGLDFYAPQTFADEKGRRILIGWMGLPDIAEEYGNPTVASGWQHALTLPREITYRAGRLCQMPVEELKLLRRNERNVETGETSVLSGGDL